MPSCYVRTALAMALGRSCGGLNINLGKWVKRPRHPTTVNTWSSNHVPWIVIGVCSVLCVVLMYAIRVLLARENRRRDAEPPDDSFDDVHVVRIDEDGSRTEVKVSKVRVRSHEECYITC
jgi:hypothetical protein